MRVVRMGKKIIAKQVFFVFALFCFSNIQAYSYSSAPSEALIREMLISSGLTQYKRLLHKQERPKILAVTATAYTSHVGQTDSTPNIAAWGDRLHPGMKVIAVSHDLLNTYGLKHRSKVKIRGLSGEYLVLDKMNRRWRKKIDIYMGKNKNKAFQWGRRKVVIEWTPESTS